MKKEPDQLSCTNQINQPFIQTFVQNASVSMDLLDLLDDCDIKPPIIRLVAIWPYLMNNNKPDLICEHPSVKSNLIYSTTSPSSSFGTVQNSTKLADSIYKLATNLKIQRFKSSSNVFYDHLGNLLHFGYGLDEEKSNLELTKRENRKITLIDCLNVSWFILLLW